MAEARHAVQNISCTKFIQKWPTSFTKTNEQLRLESSSFGHHCFLHRNNPAWLSTASATIPIDALDSRNWLVCSTRPFLRGTDIYLTVLESKLTEQGPWRLRGNLLWFDDPLLQTFALKSNLTITAKSQPAPLVPCFALDHRHRPGLRVANGGHVSCCAQHVTKHVLEEEVCLCPTFFWSILRSK